MRSLLVALCLVPAVAQAGKFGGVSADGTRYLDGKNSVCAPAAVDAEGKPLGSPTCADEDAAAVKARAFNGRARPQKSVGPVALEVRWDGPTLEISGDAGSGPRPLVVWDAPADIKNVRGPWIVKDSILVVELATAASKTSALTVGFDVSVPLAALLPKPGGVVDRISKRGTFSQRLIPCEQAGVTFVLKDRKASITIESKCGRDRDKLRVSGRYKIEEPDRLTVTFENQDGPDEELVCRVQPCEDNASLDCIRCDSEDVSFTARPAL